MMLKLILLIILLANLSHAADVTAFVAPDSSFAALKGFLADARELKIATYTFTSSDIAELLHGNVTILVDASPVGGFPAESKAVLCDLTKKGVRVYLYDGTLRFMHAKYIVKDGAALITSENMGDDGFPASPTHGNRGWGAVVQDESVHDQLEGIFMDDLKDSKSFVCDGNYSTQGNKADGAYNPSFKPEKFENQSVSLIIAPDAIPPLLELINSADTRILAEQFYIYRYFDRKTRSANPLLEALIDAAGRGVNVSVLLDSYSYNIESDDPSSNLHTNEYLNTIGEEENLPLKSKLTDLSNGILKLHNKGLIVDDSVLISSINWNENSPTRNREVGIVVTGDAAGYFADVFNYDFYPENRITGLAPTVRNYIGILILLLVVVVILRMRRRSKVITYM